MLECPPLKPISEFESADDASRELDAFGWPPVLVKACVDPFSYAAGLRDGRIVRFHEVDPIDQNWVTLYPHHSDNGLPFPAPRGPET